MNIEDRIACGQITDEIEDRLFNTFMRGWHAGASASECLPGFSDSYSRGYDAGVRALQAARKLARKNAKKIIAS